MTMHEKFLVLVDGSERSIQTVNYVKDFLPVDEDTRIVLFHVFSGLPEEYQELEHLLGAWGVEQEKRVWEYLEQAKTILTTGGIPERLIEIKFQPMKKGVARDIIAEAGNGYSAVVLSRRGMGSLKSIMLGSVAVKLLESLTFVPIIIVGHAPPVKKLLLAVDASPSSMKAVEFAASLLGGREYEVCILHAILGLGSVNFAHSETIEQDGHPEVGTDMEKNCIEAFKLKIVQLFQNIKGVLKASGFGPGKISEKIISGVYSRSETIVKEAEAGGYGTIVVGRRGLSKVEAFFMGRVGHKVVYGGKKFTVWVV